MKQAQTELKALQERQIQCKLLKSPIRITFKTLQADEIFHLANVYGVGKLKGKLRNTEKHGLHIAF